MSTVAEPNETIRLIREYCAPWSDWVDNPDYLEADEHGVYGYMRGLKACLEEETHCPSRLMHILIDDGNALDSDIEWLLNRLQNDPAYVKEFYPPFVADSIRFLHRLREIPEEQRAREINIY